MKIETERLEITELTPDMARDIHEGSLDAETARFVPDEVFASAEEARKAVVMLTAHYTTLDGPLVYAVVEKESGCFTGYVQLVPMKGGAWEIGYHISEKYRGRGFAAEAVRAFLPVMAETLGIRKVYGVCLKENAASCRVLEKCGFERRFAGRGEYQGKIREIAEYIWKK